MNINAKDIFIKEKKKKKYFIHGAKKTLYLSIIKFIYNYNCYKLTINNKPILIIRQRNRI